jgi:hypothetical protein
MIEPRCLIQEDGRSCLFQDDFAVGENGFVAVSKGELRPPVLAAPSPLPLKQRPDIGAPIVAGFTNECRLRIGQPNITGQRSARASLELSRFSRI